MPGIGPIVTAGPLGADLGEAIGHATGGLASALERAGLSRATASSWQAKIEGGAVLLGVHTRGEQATDIRRTLEHSGADGVAMANWGR
jgi:hypothetical protein